jgi:hypothetical protein
MEVMGLDLNTAELYTLFALQKIFAASDYQGNLFGISNEQEVELLDGYNHPAGHRGAVPYFKFSRSDFLEAYGLTKRKTARGKMEYGGRESERAIQTMISLFGRKFQIDYSYRYVHGKREEINLMRVEESLIEPFGRMWEGLNQQEYEALKRGETNQAIEKKLTQFIIRPSVLLLFIKDYFALKPQDFHQQIAKALKRVSPEQYVSKYTVLICEFVWLQGVMRRVANQSFTMSRSLENLAYNLRMMPLIQKREWKRIRALITEGLNVAKEMALLDDYLLPPEGQKDGLVEFAFNPEQFPALR